MKKSFTVASSNATNKGTFVTKLVCESVVSHPIFGDKFKKETYYISGSKQLNVGDTHEIDITEFVVTERPYESPETGEIIGLKWLSIK